MAEEEFYAKIRYLNGDGEEKLESLFGEDSNYGFNEPNQPPYAKIYKGNRTFIVPIANVIAIESVSRRKK